MHLFCRNASERAVNACSIKPLRSSDAVAMSDSWYASPEWAVHGTVKEKLNFNGDLKILEMAKWQWCIMPLVPAFRR